MNERREILVDARGHRCPTPSLRLIRAFRLARRGDQIRLLADDPLARIDIPHLVRQVDARLVSMEQGERETTFVVLKGTGQ